MYNKRLVGSRTALAGDTVTVSGVRGFIVQDGCTNSLVRLPVKGGQEERWEKNENITLVKSHPRNSDYLA